MNAIEARYKHETFKNRKIIDCGLVMADLCFMGWIESQLYSLLDELEAAKAELLRTLSIKVGKVEAERRVEILDPKFIIWG